MATPPTRVAASVGDYSTTTSPKATPASFVVAVGDVIVDALAVADERATAENYNWSNVGANVFTETGQTSGTITADVYMTGAYAVATAGATAAVSVTRATGDVVAWGHSAVQFTATQGVGAIAIRSGNGGNPTGTITPLYDNSSLVVWMSEYSAVDASAATWAAINGFTPTSGNAGELLKATTAGQYTNAVSVYPDIGMAGTAQTFGFTTNVGTDWQWVAIEVRGTAVIAPAFDAGAFDTTSFYTTDSSGATGTLSASLPIAIGSMSGAVTAPTYTGTLAATLSGITAALSGTAAGPSYTGTLSAATPKTTGALAGTVTAPTYTGTLAATTPTLTGTLAGTFAGATGSGSLAATLPVVTGSISGTTTAPVYAGTLAAPTPKVTGATPGTVTAPVYSGTLAGTTPKPTGSVAGTATPPTYSGTLARNLPRPVTSSIAGTVSAPVYAGTITAAIPPTRSTIAGTTTVPVVSGTMAGTPPKPTGSIGGTVVAPVATGTLNAQLARIVAATQGVVTTPAAVALKLKVGTVAPSNTVTPPPAHHPVTAVPPRREPAPTQPHHTIAAAPPTHTTRSAT